MDKSMGIIQYPLFTFKDDMDICEYKVNTITQ